MIRTAAKRSGALLVALAMIGACSRDETATSSVPAVEQPGTTSTLTTTESTPSPILGEPQTPTSPTSAPPATTDDRPSTTPPSAVSPATTPPTTEPPVGTEVPAELACLDRLTIADKAALLVWPSVYPNDWSTAVDVVGELGLGGVLLMRPRLTESELTARIAELDNAGSLGVLVATDEEGGDVQRLKDIEPFPSQREVSTARTVDEARNLVGSHAQLVARVGVDVVLGPVVDVLPEHGVPPLQPSRFFDGGPDAVSEWAAAYIDGWESAGLLATLKHFPGHGAASGDTHDTQGLTPGLDQLETRDLIPYRDLAGRDVAVMIGHLTVPGLTDGRPATTSPAAGAYLRDTLGYSDALVISDALDMAAAGDSIPAVAVASIASGIDVVLFTATGQAATVIENIVRAVDEGEISASRLDDAAGRVLDLLESRGGGCNRE